VNYEYAGMKYNKTKFFQTVWFPDKKSSHMKLLIIPNNPCFGDFKDIFQWKII